MKRWVGILLANVVIVWSTFASGPEYYVTPFVDRLDLDDVIAGDFPDRLSTYDIVIPLIVYLHLNGRFTDHHAVLFRLKYVEPMSSDDFERMFWLMVQEEGYESPARFRSGNLVSQLVATDDDYLRWLTTSYYYENCQIDAYKTAAETLSDRKLRYGSGTIELSRWIEAQIKVFAQCSGETAFDPPEEPALDWLPLEQHDRRYQIAAAYFYDRQYLEASSRFDEIGQTSDSPWRDLGRYLVGRSLAREAIINENEPTRHLELALIAYQELAEDPVYLAAFPSVSGQIRYIRTRIDSCSRQTRSRTTDLR